MYGTDTHKYTPYEQILEIKYGLLYNYQGSRQYLAKMLAYYFVVCTYFMRLLIYICMHKILAKYFNNSKR